MADQLTDPDAPYPDGCGPDCPGCDPCVCGHPWSDHDLNHETWPGCGECDCNSFDSQFKVRVYFPEEQGRG